MIEDNKFLIEVSKNDINGILDRIDDIQGGIGRYYDYTTIEDINLNKEQKEYINKVLEDIYKTLEETYEDLSKIG
jgi:predicted transcriptional regulator